MLFYQIWSILIILITAWLIATQIVLPAYRDRHSFPFFRKKTRDLHHQLMDVNQDLDDQRLEDLILEKRKELEEHR